ncbi:MAG: hypothetical protein KKA73_23350 [Chloroflexi bacterium]|nr:hypothetical protein [Chloroflexota bacterium]MBU1750628.1 hypothetical protein [Chloroflexota bacterium]
MRYHARMQMWIGLVLAVGLLASASCTPPQSGSGGARPWVNITAPASGSRLTVGQEVSIQVQATDTQGVARIEIKVDGNLVGTAQSAVAQGEPALVAAQPWTFTQPGTHIIMAQATNAAGQASDPAVVNVQVTGGGEPTAVLPTTPPGQPTAVLPTVPPAPTAAGCVDDSAFLADVTVPDDSVWSPGARIDKIWRMKNTGTCTWGAGYRWAFVRGAQMNAPESVAVPYTEPGQTADLQVVFTAPQQPGTYTSYWQLRDPNGDLMGHRTMMRIIVPQPGPGPTQVPPPTPVPVINFWADDTTLHPGQCTWIHWDVEYVIAVYLQENGGPEHGVAGHDKRWVCPATDTTYHLRIVTPAGDQHRYITLWVSPYY